MPICTIILFSKAEICIMLKTFKMWVVLPAKLLLFLQLTVCILMDFPIHIDTISMGLPSVYFKGLQVVVSKL